VGWRARTGWQAEFGVVEVEVDDFGQRVHLCDFEVADELCQTIFELGVCVVSVSVHTQRNRGRY